MTHVQMSLLRYRHGAEENIERLFQAAFTPGPVRPDQVTLFGWKPVTDWYNEPASIPDMWRHATAVQMAASEAVPEVEPEVRLRRLADRLRIDVRLPFLIRASVRVEVRDNVLTLRGEQAVPGEQGVMDSRVPPRRPFQRVFPLPRDAANGSVKARFHGEETVRIEVTAGEPAI